MGCLGKKVAVLTGAARGQGRTTALPMLEEGCALALTDVGAAGLRETVEEVQKQGGRVVHWVGDITEPSTIDALVSLALDAFGRIDVLHNNAGILVANSLEDVFLASDASTFMTGATVPIEAGHSAWLRRPQL